MIRAAKRTESADRRRGASGAQVGSKQRARIDFTAAAALKKWPSIGNQRAAASLGPYLVIEGTLDACIRGFFAKPASQRHLYEIHTAPQTQVITAVLGPEQIAEIARLRDFL
jgi:hypothetical protein